MSGRPSGAGQALRRFRSLRYTLVVEGVAVGAAAGMTAVVFRLLLEQGDALRAQVGTAAEGRPWAAALWIAALLGLAGLVALLLRWEPYISGSGIPQVEGELQGALKQAWWRVLPAKLLGGVLSIGAGLSLGREGPSIQLGAMAGKGVSRLLRRQGAEEKALLTCGAGAGLAAAFNAPFAGVLFCLEELHKDFSTEVLLSAMSASITADFLSRMVCGLNPVFDFSSVEMMPLGQYWAVLALGAVLGLAGAFYNLCLEKTQGLMGKIPWPYLRLAIPFALAGVLLWVYPLVLGGGHTLVELAGTPQPLGFLLALLAAKFAFSMVSFGSGAPGGIFLPLLVLGAVLGSSWSQVLCLLGLEAQASNFVILGMAGMFSSIVRAPVTGVVLISEMTGSFSHLLTLSMVSLAAYAVADLVGSRPVYDMLLSRLLKKAGAPEGSGEKLLVEATVCHGSPADGRAIRQMSWPGEALVVAVRRGEREFVPHGGTTLRAGDVLTLLCEDSAAPQAHAALEEQCKAMGPAGSGEG